MYEVNDTSSMFDKIIGVYEALLKNDKFFLLHAKTQKKMFDAFVAEGFTKEQAVKLLCSMGAFLKTS